MVAKHRHGDPRHLHVQPLSYVIHVAELLETMHGVCNEHGVAMCGINSNDISTHPDDSPEKMLQAAAGGRGKREYTNTFVSKGVSI